MADSNRFKLDPNIVNMVSKSKGINYGHAMAKAFTDIGGIAEQQKENELKQIETDTKRLQYESVADTLADDKKFAELVTSDDPKAYMQKNPFKTSKYVTLTNDFIDTNKNKLSKEQQDKHFAMASSMFTKEDGSFDIGGAKGFLKKQYESGKIDADTFHNVVDTIGQKTKTGVYAETKKPYSIAEQIKIAEYSQNKENDKKLENDLFNVRDNYKKLFGKEMTTAQELAYKKNGELPYMEYGTKNLPEKRKQLIDSNILIEKALGRLDKYTIKDVEEVAGSIQGEDIAMWVREKSGALTPKQKEIATILGYINSEKMHELYGAALTGGEIGRARKWNLDINQRPELLLTAVNELRTKNKESLEHNTQGVYGVPVNDLSFKMFDIEQKENTQKVMSREEKIKFLQGN